MIHNVSALSWPSSGAASGNSHITKRHLQRIIGLAKHLAKIVRAARVFICRILMTLRAAHDAANIFYLQKSVLWLKIHLNQLNVLFLFNIHMNTIFSLMKHYIYIHNLDNALFLLE